MKIKEIKAKSIITKSGLPEAEFVINPYVGCMHGCVYCYARFMKRFTGHGEPWGAFVDVKINAPDLVPSANSAVGRRYKGRSIVIGSVTDPYHAVERKYGLTRRIIEKLIHIQPYLEIITKSDLVARDADLLKQFRHCDVAVSVSLLDEKVSRELEPLAPPAERRIKVLKELHEKRIATVAFISPILPGLTDWREIIRKTKPFVDEYWFENLNLYPSVRENIFRSLRKNRPELVEDYKRIYSHGSGYWAGEERKIREFCKKSGVKFKIYFHHRGK